MFTMTVTRKSKNTFCHSPATIFKTTKEGLLLQLTEAEEKSAEQKRQVSLPYKLSKIFSWKTIITLFELCTDDFQLKRRFCQLSWLPKSLPKNLNLRTEATLHIYSIVKAISVAREKELILSCGSNIQNIFIFLFPTYESPQILRTTWGKSQWARHVSKYKNLRVLTK